jgi:hypothetical protein
LLLAAEQAGLDFLDVICLVHALEQVGIGGADFDDLLGAEDAAVEQHVLGYAEFFHRERMPGGQIQFEFL